MLSSIDTCTSDSQHPAEKLRKSTSSHLIKCEIVEIEVKKREKGNKNQAGVHHSMSRDHGESQVHSTFGFPNGSQ